MINEFGLYRNVKPRYLIPDLKSDRTLDEQTQGGGYHIMTKKEIFI